MHIGPTEILDTYAEAFGAWYARLVISACDMHWLKQACDATSGYGTSVIGCDAEVGVEGGDVVSPDGRAAAVLLLFAFSRKKLAKAVGGRVGQCVLTCPTTACFDGLPKAEERIPLGDYVHFFGDGFEVEDGDYRDRAVWRIPVMDGEFVVERTAGVARGVAGGNFVIQATTQKLALAGALRAAGALEYRPGIITPFPGGVCRSGSKVGSRYKKLVASTHEAFSPSLRGRVSSQLVAGAACAYEIVIDGVDLQAVAGAMRVGIEAAAGEGVVAIGAGNYGGKLGKIRIGLRELYG